MRAARMILFILLAVGILLQGFTCAGEAATVIQLERVDKSNPVVKLPFPRYDGIPGVIRPADAGKGPAITKQPRQAVRVNPTANRKIPVTTSNRTVPKTPVPVSLMVTPSYVEVAEGKTAQVKVTVKYSDGSLADVTNQFSMVLPYLVFDKGTIKALKGNNQLTIDLFYGNLKTELTVLIKPPAVNVKPPNMSSPSTTYSIRWTNDGRTYALNVAIPNDLLRYDKEVQAVADKCMSSYATYLSLPPGSVVKELAGAIYSNYNVTPWVTEKYNYSFLSGVASQLKSMLTGLNRYQVADTVLKMVQYRGYHVVRPPQLPVQTLVEGGDCDGLAVLYAALLKNMGYDVALLYYAPGVLDPNAGHMLAGVALNDNELPAGGTYEYVQYNGKKYYYAETTSIGWKVGMKSCKPNPSAVYEVK